MAKGCVMKRLIEDTMVEYDMWVLRNRRGFKPTLPPQVTPSLYHKHKLSYNQRLEVIAYEILSKTTPNTPIDDLPAYTTTEEGSKKFTLCKELAKKVVIKPLTLDTLQSYDNSMINFIFQLITVAIVVMVLVALVSIGYPVTCGFIERWNGVEYSQCDMVRPKSQI